MASRTAIEKPSDLVVVGNDTIKKVPVPHDEVMDDFTEEAMDQLLKHRFPGNYRELYNIIRRAFVLSEGKIITSNMLEIDINGNKPIVDRGEETEIDNIPLKDIIDYARQRMVEIVKCRIKGLYLKGQNLKGALAAEGIESISGYQTFRNKAETIIGIGEIGNIKRECKLRKKSD